jgi:hypothetical protein
VPERGTASGRSHYNTRQRRSGRDALSRHERNEMKKTVKKNDVSNVPWDVWIVVNKEFPDELCQLKDNGDREGVFLLWNRCYAGVLAREQSGKVVRGWLFDRDPRKTKLPKKRKAKK